MSLLLLLLIHAQGIVGIDTHRTSPQLADIGGLSIYGFKPPDLARLEAETAVLNPQQIRLLANAYNSGTGGKSKNHYAASALYQLAHTRGDQPALYLLARQHHFGLGVKRELETAQGLYHLAADQGSHAAMVVCAWLAAEAGDLVTAGLWAKKAGKHQTVPPALQAAVQGKQNEHNGLKLTIQDPWSGITLISIPAGSFSRGSPLNEPGRRMEETQAKVTLSKPFFLGRHEVTQGQWLSIMSEDHVLMAPSQLPVTGVNYHMVQTFITRLNLITRGAPYRLPTEAEWEYAARAGTTSAYSTGSTITAAHANIDGRYPIDGYVADGIFKGAVTIVGSYPPNTWGLFDFHGNVTEWCSDRYCPYPTEPVTDPLGACESDRRVIRGGSWYFGAGVARSAARDSHRPNDLGNGLGFRLAADSGQE